jgi:hypothetical protein
MNSDYNDLMVSSTVLEHSTFYFSFILFSHHLTSCQKRNLYSVELYEDY